MGSGGARQNWSSPDGPSQYGSGRESPSQGWSNQDRPRSPWWRPSSSAGRVFLSLAGLIVLGGLATGAYLLKTYLERDARFRIEGAGSIQASGLTEVSRAEMLPVFGEDIGRNIFFVPLAERRKQLEQIPWVERATVMRLLPDQIRVSVVERQPVAFARQGQQFGLVDANGVLLTMPAAMMAQHHYSFPTLSGIDAGDPLDARKGRMAVYLRLVAELDANGQKLSSQISEIDLTDPEDARVTMQDDTTQLHFGEDRFLERYQRYKAHIAEWRKQYPKLASVDLRYDQQVVLEMAPGTNVAQVTADAQNANAGPAASVAAGKGKPSAASSGKSGAESNSAASGHRDPARTGSGKPQTKAQPVKSGTKPGQKGVVKPKSARAKEAKDKKKRADAKSAALNQNRQKTAPTARPAAAAAEGQ